MPKAKRVISEFDFEKQGAAVHLVSKKQGGAANGFKTLIRKSKATAELPDLEELEVEKKLEQIKVTMSMEEFLHKFFDMYYDHAELLTAMLGYETEHEAYMSTLDETSEPMTHADYIASKLSSFEIMKSMHEGKYEASASDYVTILELQENLENQLNEEMMDKVSIAKSLFTELEGKATQLETEMGLKKALETQVAELTTELDAIKKAKVAEKEASIKARLEGVVAEDKIEVMTKSLMSMDEESANLMIDTLTDSNKKAEESDLFVEKSLEGEPEILSEEEQKEINLQKALNKAFGVEA